MNNLVKSSFVWQFAGGFVLGAVGLLTLQPAPAEIVPPPSPATHAALQ